VVLLHVGWTKRTGEGGGDREVLRKGVVSHLSSKRHIFVHHSEEKCSFVVAAPAGLSYKVQSDGADPLTA
jgi:hypothetical protein